MTRMGSEKERRKEGREGRKEGMCFLIHTHTHLMVPPPVVVMKTMGGLVG